MIAQPARRIVGLERFVGQRDGEDPGMAIPAIREAFRGLSGGSIGTSGSEASYGLFTYEPPFGPGQSFAYLAGVEAADDGSPIPDGMVERTIPAGQFAKVTFRGPVAHIQEAWGFFHGSWREHSGYEAIDDYEYERYDARFLGTENEESVIELHVPVVRLEAPSSP